MRESSDGDIPGQAKVACRTVLNPMAGVVEGFRWALLGARLDNAQELGPLCIVSVAISLGVLAFGLFYSRRTERTSADII